MSRMRLALLLGALACLTWAGHAEGYGFGRGGGGFGGGYRGGGGYGGYRSFDSFSPAYRWAGSRGLDYSGFRSGEAYSGWRGGYGATRSYDRTYSDARGGSINVEGTRGAAVGPAGGVAAGGSRDVTATTAGGRTYSGEREGGVAVGPYGRVVGGGERAGVATGPRGTVAGGERAGFAAGPGGAIAGGERAGAASTHFPTDMGLARYSSFGAATTGHYTSYWSHGYMATRGDYVRTNFGYWHCFYPGWYAAHPGCWFAAGWAAGAAWEAASWPAVYNFIGFGSEPPYTYDYGSNVVYQNNNVYIGGQDAGTAQAFAQQATSLAEAGQSANAPSDQQWTALGVYALVQGDEKTSNNIFQLAVNKDGIIRGNFYDGVMDTTTEVYGSVDKKTQRAAWTIGKKKDRVFEAGLYNLTQPEAPVLVHFGSDKTQQWLLVRMEQPKKSGQ